MQFNLFKKNNSSKLSNSNLFKIIGSFVLIIFSQASMATVEFDEPTFVTGHCDEQTVSRTISPDGKAISMLFDNNLNLEQAPMVSSPTTSTKTCYFYVQLKSSPNFKYEILGFDWRGFVGLPKKSTSVIESRLWLVHNQLDWQYNQKLVVDDYNYKKKTITGPINTDIFLKQRIYEPTKVTSCGADYMLIIQVDMKLTNKNKSSNAMINIDTLDIAQSLSNRIVKQPCI